MGWNRPSERKVEGRSGGGQRNVHLKGLIAGVIVVLGAGIAAWLLWPNSKPPQSDTASTSTSPIREVKPAPPPKAPDPLDDPKWAGLDKTRIKKCPNGRYVYVPRRGEDRFPGERAQALALLGGSKNTIICDRRPKEDPEHPWMFHNIVQSDMVQFARPGEFAVPISPSISDKAAWEAINTPVEFHKNDTDRQIEEKQFVIDMLKQLKEHMEAGGHAKDYFHEYEKRQEFEHELMQQSINDVHSLINKGDLEGARTALEVYNRHRAERGLPIMRVRKLNGPAGVPGKK